MKRAKIVNQLKWLVDRNKPCLIKLKGQENATHWIVRLPINGDWTQTYEIMTPRENVAEIPLNYQVAVPTQFVAPRRQRSYA